MLIHIPFRSTILVIHETRDIFTSFPQSHQEANLSDDLKKMWIDYSTPKDTFISHGVGDPLDSLNTKGQISSFKTSRVVQSLAANLMNA